MMGKNGGNKKISLKNVVQVRELIERILIFFQKNYMQHLLIP
jgi:hypothetical protein